MAHKLEVWLFANHIGTLSLVNGRLCFQYHGDWLAQPHAIPLSSALPLQADAFYDVTTRPFFAGLLPEGQMRRLRGLGSNGTKNQRKPLPAPFSSFLPRIGIDVAIA